MKRPIAALIVAAPLMGARPDVSSHPAPDGVLVPAGTFTAGSGRSPDEPLRQVTLPAYRIGRHEVTIDEFARFVAQGWDERQVWSNEGWRWSRAHPDGAGAANRAAGRAGDHPVVAVTWYEADAYCRWAGGSLPTEDQWEHAACGPGGRRYPWGDDENVDAPWYRGTKYGHIDHVATITASQADPALASPTGIVNAAGNVWEWTASDYHRNPRASGNSPWKTLRGGSFANLPSYCTCTHREPARPDRVSFTIGFRCAWPAR